MALNGNYNVSRRANRSYEAFHRDRRRRGVDRLGMLEPRTGRRSSGLGGLFSALTRLLRRR